MSHVNDEPNTEPVVNQNDSEKLQLLQNRIGVYERAAKRFEDLFHRLPVACYTYDVDGCIHDWNAAASELWGYEGHLIVQRTVYETIFSEEDRDVRRSIAEQVWQGKRIDGLEIKSVTESGDTRWTLTCEMPQFSADGTVIGGLSANIDISDRKLEESSHSANEDLLRTAYEILQNGVMIIDSDFRVEVCNPSACAILGVDEKSFVGKQLTHDLFNPINEDNTPMKTEDLPSYRAAKNGEFCKDVVMGIRRPCDDETIWINVKASPIIQDGAQEPTGAVTSFSDITSRLARAQMIEQSLQQISDMNVMMEVQQMELEDANSRLENLANNDGLTGLANHRAFQDFFERQLEISNCTGREISILFIDVDLFKSFNDDFGHQIGDDVLMDVAKLMTSSVRETDLPARYGGEEFVIVLPGAQPDAAIKIAETVRKKIESHEWDHRPVTVSIGVSTLSKRDISKDDLIEEADKALYAAKDAGRNKSMHYNDLLRDESMAA